MINIYIYNQPSEDFVEEDFKVIVVLVCARGTKPTGLWRKIERAWYFKNDGPMLIRGILLFRLQSRRLTKLHGLLNLHLKRFIMKGQSFILVKVEKNIFGASGKRL